MKYLLLIFCVFISFILFKTNCDLPVHCVYAQIKGKWKLKITKKEFNNQVVYNQCKLKGKLPYVYETKIVELESPNIAYFIDPKTNSKQEKGTWTLIYDQGFEINLKNEKYFAFFNYTQEDDKKIVSHCYKTFTGWYHNDEVFSQNWGCFKAEKIFDSSKNSKINSKFIYYLNKNDQQNNINCPYLNNNNNNNNDNNKMFKNDKKLINYINSLKTTWTAKEYKFFEEKTIKEVEKMQGNKVYKFRYEDHIRHMKTMKKLHQFLNKKKNNNKNNNNKSKLNLPENFSWSDLHGIDYVGPARNQKHCGSCYSFGSTGMFSSRIRIKTKNFIKPLFSNQDIMSCSEYSQGCNGGFPYLISKYGQDFGIYEESFDPYLANVTKCFHEKESADKRTWIQDYGYIGGYYGASNEELMMKEIYENGPIAVSFFVYPDLKKYHRGVYHHVEVKNNEDPTPFEVTNHVVLCEGWGKTKAGVKYWKIRNSWGTKWGLNGFFLIRRGTDECAIESMTVKSTPIVKC